MGAKSKHVWIIRELNTDSELGLLYEYVGFSRFKQRALNHVIESWGLVEGEYAIHEESPTSVSITYSRGEIQLLKDFPVEELKDTRRN